MKRLHLHVFSLLLALCLAPHFGYTQVLPGDANDDGVVDNLDILYIGYAFGSVGPARHEERTDGAPAAVALYWEQAFPDSLNYAYADATGNGLVDEEDFAAVFQNYGRSRDGIQPARHFEEGILDIDPQLSFGTPQIFIPVTAGTELTIPISLGTANLPVSSFNGIAFTIEYDTNAISDIQLDFSDSWIATPNESFTFQNTAPLQSHNLDVASTRLGQDLLAGHGKIGHLSVVIEHDLIDFLKGRLDSANTILKFKNLVLVDNDFNKVRVTGDSIQFKIYSPQIVSTVNRRWQRSITLAPSPAREDFHIKSPIPFYQVELLTSTGQPVWAHRNTGGQKMIRIPCDHLAAATYLVRLLTDRGPVVKKVVVAGKL